MALGMGSSSRESSRRRSTWRIRTILKSAENIVHWEGLKPASPELRIQYFMHVKMKRSSSSRTNNSRKVYNSSSSSRPERVVQTVELEARKWIVS